MNKTIQITNMTCPACDMLIKDVCGDFPEITTANVDLKKGTLNITYDDTFNLSLLKEEIESLGAYKVTI